MGKLSKEQSAKLAKIGIKNCKTVEDSREAMVEVMVGLGIDDDGESWEDVYDIVYTLLDDTETENDDLADEVNDEEEEEVVAPKKSSKKKEVVVEEEDDEEVEEEDADEDTDEDAEPSLEEMKEVLLENGFTKKELKKLDDEEIEEAFNAIEEEEVEEEVVEEKKPAVKKPEPKADKKAPVKKADKKASKRLNPKENKEDAALYDVFKKALSKFGEFEFNFIANGGCSVKYLGKNSTKVFFSFDSPKMTDGKIVGRVYSSAVKTDEKLAEMFGEDFEIKKDWSGIPIMIDISLDEIIVALKENKEVFEAFLKNLEGKDTKLGKNREKMEEQLKETQKDAQKEKAAKLKAAKKAAEKAAEEAEEEEVEEEAPKKKVVKKTTKKK
jgi:hypothetical protein